MLVDPWCPLDYDPAWESHEPLIHPPKESLDDRTQGWYVASRIPQGHRPESRRRPRRWPASRSPTSTRRGQHDPRSPWSAAAAAAPARRRTPCRSSSGPTKLVAMADVFQDKLNSSHDQLKRQNWRSKTRSTCPRTASSSASTATRRRWTACKPGDVVILTTPPAFRWVQFKYAIEKGSTSSWRSRSPSTARRTAARCSRSAKKPSKKNLKVGVGLMCRHCEARGELFNRIKDGEIGDLTLLRAYRMAGPIGIRVHRAQARRHQRAACTRSSASTASSGPAAAATATSSSTTSTNAAG